MTTKLTDEEWLTLCAAMTKLDMHLAAEEPPPEDDIGRAATRRARGLLVSCKGKIYYNMR